MSEISRRRLLSAAGETLAAAAGAAGLLTVAAGRRATPADPVSRVDALPTNLTRTWIGPEYWANRLQDWRLTSGRIECLSSAMLRTVGVLTRSIAPGQASASLTVRTGSIVTGAGGSGFLIGAGAGALDWRAAALVMGASGQGGGILALYEQDGRVQFRDHTPETSQAAVPILAATARSGPRPRGPRRRTSRCGWTSCPRARARPTSC